MEQCNFSVSTICKTHDHHRRMSNSVDSDAFHSARWEPVLRFALGEPNVRIQVFGPFCVQIVTTLDGHADDIIGLRLSDQGEKLAEELATTWFHETSKDLAKLESPWLVRGLEGFSLTDHDGSMTSTAGIDYAAQGWNAPEFRGLGAGGCTRNSELKMLWETWNSFPFSVV
jgi:hypothetical protein